MASVSYTQSSITTNSISQTSPLGKNVTWRLPVTESDNTTDGHATTSYLMNTTNTSTLDWFNLTSPFSNSTEQTNETSVEVIINGSQGDSSSDRTDFEVPFLTSVCVIGFLGNILVLAVYSRKRSLGHSSSLYMLNLAIGDLLALVVMVLHITEFYHDTWPILWKTDEMCVVHRFLRYVGFNITVFTMVAIAIDRYFAICHPMKFKISFTLKRTIFIIIFLWILSLVAASPTLFMFKTVYKKTDLGDTYTGKLPFVCKLDMPDGDWFPHFKAWYFNLVLFYIPSALTFILNTVVIVEVRRSTRNARNNRRTTSKFDSAHWKVARTLFIVFIAYFLSYVLFSTYNLVFIYLPENTLHPMVKNVGLLMPYANSCMNPIIYSLFNPKFRRECLHLLCRKHRREKAATGIYTIRTENSSENLYMGAMSERNPVEIEDE
ncbi:melatonin receptor type 1B-B-like [Ptychodera flava]|uniref:melatonin receptor type 1B-B-like n=1 Tax=Ptychodera flava TaxID=63121 RepID=UPI00396A1B29